MLYNLFDPEYSLLAVLEHKDEVDINKLQEIWILEQIGPEPETDLDNIAQTQKNWAAYNFKRQNVISNYGGFIQYLVQKRNFKHAPPNVFRNVFL